jgi:Flp pilus assembly protein CpaB
MKSTTSVLRDLFRAARWHRRLLAAVAAAAAVYFGLVALSPPPPPTVAVLAAARDLLGGAVPAAADLRTVRLPSGAVPAGALKPGSDLAGRVLAGPVRAGEPLTDARFLAPSLVRRLGAESVRGSPESAVSGHGDASVAYPVRIDDAEVVALLRVGDRIDILAASSSGSPTADRVATAVAVVALPTSGRGAGSLAGSTASGALVVVSAPLRTAARIAQAAVNSRLSIALTAPG